MVRYTSGLICVALAPERVDALQLPLMVESNTEAQSTAFTVSVDLKSGTSTGISAADRSATIRALADTERGPSDFEFSPSATRSSEPGSDSPRTGNRLRDRARTCLGAIPRR
jgi:3,4-dihydroxy-2-butanone 4-phosphate synthase